MGQEITLADGMVEQWNFHDYDAMRINQCPAFDVAVLPELPSHGWRRRTRTPLGFAALANAVFGVVRRRIRALPIIEFGHIRMRLLRSFLTSAAIVAMTAGPALSQAGGRCGGGLAPIGQVYADLSHPRCANCHVEDNWPRWSGAHYGATRVHGFNVQRGADGSGFGNPGLRCTTYHV